MIWCNSLQLTMVEAQHEQTLYNTEGVCFDIEILPTQQASLQSINEYSLKYLHSTTAKVVIDER